MSQVFEPELEYSRKMIPILPAVLKFTSFLTIVAMGLFKTSITYGIIKAISFPFEMQLESTHEVGYALPIFSYFWELVSVLS